MKKLKTIIISAVLCLILGVTAIVPSFFSVSLSLPTRDVDVDNIGTLSYNEKVDELLSNFSSYNATSDDNVVYFEAEVELDFNSISQLAFVSTTDIPVTKKYSTRLDMENEKFYIVTKYIQDGEVINEEEMETEPIYEEYEDDYYLLMPDGTKSSVKSLLAQDNLDECLILTATTASYAAVALLAVTVVVMAPTVVQSFVTVVTAVVTWIRSFFSWFRSLFTKKTTYVTTTTLVTTLTPSISIAGTKVETKTITKSDTKTMTVNVFYLCFADPTNGKMYVSTGPINYNVALMVMSTPILVPCIGNPNKDMIASVFTINQFMAFEIASAAGIAKPYPECHGADYYMHYHSIVQARTRQGTWARPHAFFTTITL